MELLVLGPPELWSAEQQYDIGPTRVRGLLAILSLGHRAARQLAGSCYRFP